MNLNEYLLRRRADLMKCDGMDLLGFEWTLNPSVPLAPRIYCADGFNLSVQADSGKYCSPRNNTGPYHTVEVGFPSAEPELIMEYCESPSDPTGTVYGYVPIELVEQLIELHGGQV